MSKPSRYLKLEAAVLAVETDQSLNHTVLSKLSKLNPMVIEMNLKEEDPSRFKINRDKIINRGETFDFAVGKKSLERAKLILDTFIKAVEKRGLKIINSGGNTFLLISEVKIQIRLWEKSRFLEKDENTYGYRDQELSGDLYFQNVEMGRYINKQWGDTR